MPEIEGSLRMSGAASVPTSEPYALRINRSDPHFVPADGAAHRLPATRILGVPVSVIDMPFAVRTLSGWARARRTRNSCRSRRSPRTGGACRTA